MAGAGGPRVPPPFPVVAPPKTGKTTPPIPHIAAHSEPAMPEAAAPAPAKAPIWKNRKIQIGAAAAILVAAAGGAWFVFRPANVPPPPKAVKPAAAAPKAATPTPTSAVADKPAAPAPALSETQAAIAHAPVNAINKAKDVVGKREGSGQGRDAVGAITDGEPPAPKALATRPAARVSAPTVAGSSSIAPGISATNADVAAESEASPAFRSFVANAKVSGVFQGNPPRVMLNGRLARGGDTIDSNLGVIFDSVDPDKKLLIFKDKSGATVTRRY